MISEEQAEKVANIFNKWLGQQFGQRMLEELATVKGNKSYEDSVELVKKKLAEK